MDTKAKFFVREPKFFERLKPYAEIDKSICDKLEQADSRAVDDVDGMVLMSGAEFASGGHKLMGIPVCITPDGKPPKPIEDMEPPIGPIDEIKDPVKR